MKYSLALALAAVMLSAANGYAAENMVQTDTNLQTTIEQKAVEDKATQPAAEVKSSAKTDTSVQAETPQAAPADKSATPLPTSMDQGTQVEVKATVPKVENFLNMLQGKKKPAAPGAEASAGTEAEVKQ